MNGPPIPPEPSDGFDLDEGLNALVDDELSAFAHDRGVAEETVRARLVAMPDFAARRAEIERARAAIREPIAPLDDVTRRRLVRDATQARDDAPAPRSRRWIAATAIAAAAALVVAGIGVAVSSMGDTSSTSSSSSDRGVSGTAPLRGDVGDLGDVTSPAALKGLLDRRAAEAGDPSTTRSPAQSEHGTGGDADDATKRAPTASPADTTKCAQQLAGRRTVVFTGTGTYQGAPVTIVGITTGGRTVVFIVSDADCTDVVASISR